MEITPREKLELTLGKYVVGEFNAADVRETLKSYSVEVLKKVDEFTELIYKINGTDLKKRLDINNKYEGAELAAEYFKDLRGDQLFDAILPSVAAATYVPNNNESEYFDKILLDFNETALIDDFFYKSEQNSVIEVTTKFGTRYTKEIDAIRFANAELMLNESSSYYIEDEEHRVYFTPRIGKYTVRYSGKELRSKSFVVTSDSFPKKVLNDLKRCGIVASFKYDSVNWTVQADHSQVSY